MTQTDISVIVPCFNGAKYLPRLADSLRGILAPNIEVILVDDGSTDGSAELFENLFPSGICLKQINCGVGAARNRAVEIAQGEFLQLLDVDDTIEEDKLQEQWKFVVASGCDVVYSDWRMVIVEGDKETCERWVDAGTGTEIVEALLGGWWFPLGAALVRKQAYRSVGGCDTTLRNTCEDFDLWVRLAIAGCRFGYLPGRFANYYRHLNVRSMSRTNPYEFFEGEAKVILKTMRMLDAQKAATLARRQGAARRLHAVARNVFSLDRERYHQLMDDVRSLDPKFRPVGTLSYRLAARILGFDFAEYLAVWKRKTFSKTPNPSL